MCENICRVNQSLDSIITGTYSLMCMNTWPLQGHSHASCLFSRRNVCWVVFVLAIRRQSVLACELTVTVCFHSITLFSVCLHLNPHQSVLLLVVSLSGRKTLANAA